METLTNKRKHGGHKPTFTNKKGRRRDDSPPATAQPCWLILNSCTDKKGSDSSVADPKTTAASCTSSGKPFSISFGIATPPASCSLHFDWLGGGGMPGDRVGSRHPKLEPEDVRVIAGHGDAVLVQMRVPNPKASDPFDYFDRFDTMDKFDYFLYQAGGGARPPSLSPLPGCYIPTQFDRMTARTRRDPRNLRMKNTGVLRRGEDYDDDDVVVCQLEMTCGRPVFEAAELCMLRIGRDDHEWTVRRLPIVQHREGTNELQPWDRHCLFIQAVVPVGNRFLCWVYYDSGFIVCDMAADEEKETPRLRYVPLPPAAMQRDAYWLDDADLRCCRTLGAAGPDTVRFVTVAQRSSSSFSIVTCTLTLSMEEATTWVMDAVLDCDEIWNWQLPNYGCLPRDKLLKYPVVRCDEPHVICFRVEGIALEINMRSKKLLSVIPTETRDEDEDEESSKFITAKLCW